MEIDITHLVSNYEMTDFSASIAETRNPNIGKVTWGNACKYITQWGTLCDDKDYLVEYFVEFGAWSEEELQADTLNGLNAMLVQIIAGDIREDEGSMIYEHDDRTYYLLSH